MLEVIAALQFITLMPLLDVSMPANADSFFTSLTKISSFDIVEIGDFVDRILDLLPSSPVSYKFEAIGLESAYFINNLGSFIFVIAAQIILVIIWAITSPLSTRGPQRL